MQPLQQERPTRRQNKPRRAGGWNIVDGGYDFHLVRRCTMQKWRTAVKKVLLTARKKDPRIERMLVDAATEWSTYACPSYQSWASLTPLEKQHALFTWILKQKKRSALDILVAGIAGLLHFTLIVQPRHDAYARAVSCARSVWFLLRKERRTYETDSGQGTTRVQHVWINKRIRIRSRNAAQKIEAQIQRHAGWFIEAYSGQLVPKLSL